MRTVIKTRMALLSMLLGMSVVCVTSRADETFEGTFSASFADQMQSCTAAQDQAERVVRAHFRNDLSSGASSLSVSGKRCECSRSTRFATPLYECIGYATGSIADKEAFDDGACSSILTSNSDPATLVMRTSSYLTCVRRLPHYNRSWDVQALQRSREAQ